MVITEVLEKVSVLPVAKSSESWVAASVPRLNSNLPPVVMVVLPPMTPVPPRVAPELTLTAPAAAVWLPLMNSFPSLTVVVPV